MKDLAIVPPVIIGGSAEALALARRVPGALVRLSRGERVPRDWPGRVETGEITAAWLSRTGASALVIAAHPFDAATARAAARAADALGVPRVTLRRPGWKAAQGARWIRIGSSDRLPRVIPAGSRVFAATGREDLAALRRLRARIFLRRVSGREADAPGVVPVPGTPPFTIADEMRLFRRLGVEWLVLRDAGGPGARPKLDAARRLGMRVALIDRPAWPEGPSVTTPQEALTWLSRTVPSAASS